MEGGLAGARYGVTESGWMDKSNFLSWFRKLLLRAVAHLTETGPVLLFQDGHHSHINLELIKVARDNNVLLLCLPPNTTHLLQPLDIGVFGPLKGAWRSIVKLHKLKIKGANISKEVFPSLVTQLWDCSFTPDHCKGGFRGAGLVPFSRKHVIEKIIPPGATVGSTNSDADREGCSMLKCTGCGQEMAATPIIKLKLIAHFSGRLEVEKTKPAPGQRNRLKVRLEGEAITSDSFMELMEADKAEKECKKAEKNKKKRGKKQKEVECAVPESTEVDENICQECGSDYNDDEYQYAWIGCNNDCGRWFHYWCAGFDRKPSARKKFICYFC